MRKILKRRGLSRPYTYNGLIHNQFISFKYYHNYSLTSGRNIRTVERLKKKTKLKLYGIIGQNTLAQYIYIK